VEPPSLDELFLRSYSDDETGTVSA
jgi:hypothetical protein